MGDYCGLHFGHRPYSGTRLMQKACLAASIQPRRLVNTRTDAPYRSHLAFWGAAGAAGSARRRASSRCAGRSVRAAACQGAHSRCLGKLHYRACVT
ncbi:protein of unknown function (plasmid) [Caballeronia sp. S22]